MTRPCDPGRATRGGADKEHDRDRAAPYGAECRRHDGRIFQVLACAYVVECVRINVSVMKKIGEVQDTAIGRDR